MIKQSFNNIIRSNAEAKGITRVEVLNSDRKCTLCHIQSDQLDPDEISSQIWDRLLDLKNVTGFETYWVKLYLADNANKPAYFQVRPQYDPPYMQHVQYAGTVQQDEPVDPYIGFLSTPPGQAIAMVGVQLLEKLMDKL
jgi:hypothetical protein